MLKICLLIFLFRNDRDIYYCSLKYCTHFQCKQELENPLILIHEKKISDINGLVRVLEIAIKVMKIISTEILGFTNTVGVD